MEIINGYIYVRTNGTTPIKIIILTATVGDFAVVIMESIAFLIGVS